VGVKLKILFLTNLYPPNAVGGYERLCHQVAEALADQGDEIFVLTSDFGDRQADIPNQTVWRTLNLLADKRDIYRPIEMTPARQAAINQHNVRELKRTVAEIRPDLVFAWNLYFLDASFEAALAELSPPTVFFLTDNWLIAAKTPERIHRFFDRYVHGRETFLPEQIKAVDDRSPYTAMFGSEFVRQLYHSCGYGFNREMVVHNGVAPPQQDPILAPDRSKLSRPDELRLLFAGRFVDIKGAQDCVAALPLISKAVGAGTRVSLTMIGDMTDGMFMEQLEKEIAASDCADRITLRPPVSEGELMDEFNTHDIYLFPSLYEPFALTLILAMAAGIPTIASQVGGNPEIVHHRQTGLLYEKGDIAGLVAATELLHQDPALRVRLSERGRRFARRFTFSRMVRQIRRQLANIAAESTVKPILLARRHS